MAATKPLMPTLSDLHYRFRLLMTLAIAAAHASLAILGLFNRLNYIRPSRYQFLLDVVGSNVWPTVHGAVALGIVVALTTKHGQVSAVSAATGVMGSWAFLSMLWGLSVVNGTPVSLVGPVLGCGIATLSFLLAASWARSDGHAEHMRRTGL